MKRRIGLAATLAVLGLAVFAGSAAAAPPETPNEFVGACNMLASWPDLGPAKGVGVQPDGGMEKAMFGTPAYERFGYHNGNLGMDHAVFVSGGGVVPPNC